MTHRIRYILTGLLASLVMAAPAQGEYVFNPGATEATPPWDLQQSAGDNRLEIVPDPLGNNRQVQKWTVLDNDVFPLTPTDNPRAQILSPDFWDNGEEYYVGISYYFPSIPRSALSDDNWNSLGSVYGPPTEGASNGTFLSIQHGGPNGAAPSFYMRINYPTIKNIWTMPAVTGKWVDVIHRIKLSTSDAVGFREMWINTGIGFIKQALNGSTAPYFHVTMSPANDDGPNFVKQSQYRRKGMFSTMTSYSTPIKVATSFDEVDPGTYTQTPPGDTEAPTTPSLSGTAGDGQTTLNWTASTDNVGVTAYQIRDGNNIVLRTVAGTVRTTTFTGLANGVAQTYTVKAKDAAGNLSLASNSVTLTPAAPVADRTKPTAAVLSISDVGNNDGDITLSWSGSTDNVGVVRHDVHEVPQKYVRTVNLPSRTTTITGLTNGTTKNYIVVALDAAGNIGPWSNQVSGRP